MEKNKRKADDFIDMLKQEEMLYKKVCSQKVIRENDITFFCPCGEKLNFYSIDAMKKESLKEEWNELEICDNYHSLYVSKGKINRMICPEMGSCKVTEKKENFLKND